MPQIGTATIGYDHLCALNFNDYLYLFIFENGPLFFVLGLCIYYQLSGYCLNRIYFGPV